MDFFLKFRIHLKWWYHRNQILPRIRHLPWRCSQDLPDGVQGLGCVSSRPAWARTPSSYYVRDEVLLLGALVTLATSTKHFQVCSVTRMSFDHQGFFCTGSHTAVFQVTCMVIMVIIIGNVSRIAVGHIVTYMTYIFFNITPCITPRLSLSRRRGTVFVLTSCQHYGTIRFVSQTLFSVLALTEWRVLSLLPKAKSVKSSLYMGLGLG